MRGQAVRFRKARRRQDVPQKVNQHKEIPLLSTDKPLTEFRKENYIEILFAIFTSTFYLFYSFLPIYMYNMNINIKFIYIYIYIYMLMRICPRDK